MITSTHYCIPKTESDPHSHQSGADWGRRVPTVPPGLIDRRAQKHQRGQQLSNPGTGAGAGAGAGPAWSKEELHY